MQLLDFLGWRICVLFLIVVLLVMWAIIGGNRSYKVVGLSPLSIPTGNTVPGSVVKAIGELPPVEGQALSRTLKPPEMIPDQPCIPNKKLSVGEQLTGQVLEELLGRSVMKQARPSFLMNAETGRCLEMDCYDPVYRLCVEYNGSQHYTYPSAFIKTKEQFEDQIYRDNLKRELCDREGIYLIVVPYWVDMCSGNPFNDPQKKVICSTSVKREVRYSRIKDFLSEKLREYQAAVERIHQAQVR